MNLISCFRNLTLKLYYSNQKCTKSRTLFHFHIIESFGSYIKTFRLYYQNFNVPKVETYFTFRNKNLELEQVLELESKCFIFRTFIERF